MKFLLDSVIFIDALRDYPAAEAFILTNEGRCVVTAITVAEVVAGSVYNDKGRVRSLIDAFTFVAVDKQIAERAGELRHLYRWKLPDAFQAATALEHGLLLATRNTKDFDPALYPFVAVPYKA